MNALSLYILMDNYQNLFEHILVLLDDLLTSFNTLLLTS